MEGQRLIHKEHWALPLMQQYLFLQDRPMQSTLVIFLTQPVGLLLTSQIQQQPSSTMLRRS